MMFAILAALSIVQVYSLPASNQNGIDWSKYEPRYPTVSPWDGKTDLPLEVLLRKIQDQEPVRERYPGYKKGTKSFAGDCGLPGPAGKIVGGEEATPHQYPWMAALFIDDKWFCGGTLISDQWVMTAGHCADGASSVNVMLGAHNVRETVEDGRLEIASNEIFTHEDYNGLSIRNDIGLVHLPEPVQFTDWSISMRTASTDRLGSPVSDPVWDARLGCTQPSRGWSLSSSGWKLILASLSTRELTRSD